MTWFPFTLAAVLLVLGLLVHVFRFHFLISGYNTMSRAKQEKVDVRKVARLIGWWSYANAAVLVVVGVLLALDVAVPLAVPLVFFAVTTVALLVRAQRYDGNLFDADGRLLPGAWKQLAVVGVLLVALVVGVGAFLLYLSRPVQITPSDDGVEIWGMYGTTVAWDAIERVELLEELPAIELRTNGSAVGPHLRGHFRTTEYGPVLLFVNADTPPFVLVGTTEDVVILNLPTSDETRELFAEVVAGTAG